MGFCRECDGNRFNDRNRNRIVMYLDNVYQATGRLGRDPELKETTSGNVVNFSIAVSNGRDKDGNDKEPTWIDCYCWSEKADKIAQWFKKGSLIKVMGPLTPDTYTRGDMKISKPKLNVREFGFVPRNGGSND